MERTGMYEFNPDYLSPKQLRALDFAAERHQQQTYGQSSIQKPMPYLKHLVDVFLVAREYSAHHDILVSALLHDVLEDIHTNRTELGILFGSHIARIVWKVTDEPGATRKERKEATLEKTASIAESRELKLYDRIANVRQRDKIDMYRKEQEMFSDFLRMPNENTRAWFELDKLLEI